MKKDIDSRPTYNGECPNKGYDNRVSRYPVYNGEDYSGVDSNYLDPNYGHD